MVSKTTLIGHVGQDPEVRKLDNGTWVCRFSVATSESYKDASGELKTITTWHPIKAYRQNAENIGKLLKKGSAVYIEGKMAYPEYTSKEGVKKIDAHVICNEFRLLDKKEKSEPSAPQAPKPQPTPQVRQSDAGFADVPVIVAPLPAMTEDNDLPF